MLDVVIDNQMIRFGDRMGISFHRTLRVPQGVPTFPLPPGLGRFPIYEVSAFAVRLPQSWQAAGGGFIPMYQREALWIGFNGTQWKPNAVVVALGGINVVSGESADAALCDEPQNYIVAPPQPWLDGINSANGIIQQFVAMPLGSGRTVEAAVTGEERLGGIQLIVFDPKPDRFPDSAPTTEHPDLDDDGIVRPMHTPAQPMGIGAGGKIRQKIYRDPYGIDTWDQNTSGRTTLHIVNSRQFHKITGLRPPPTPIDAKQYIAHGLPWFELYDENLHGISASEVLSQSHIEDRQPSYDSVVEAQTPMNISSAQDHVIGEGAAAGGDKES